MVLCYADRCYTCFSKYGREQLLGRGSQIPKRNLRHRRTKLVIEWSGCEERPQPRLAVGLAEAAEARYLTVLGGYNGSQAPAVAARHTVSRLVVACPASTSGREDLPLLVLPRRVWPGPRLEGRTSVEGGAPASETCRPIGGREVRVFPFSIGPYVGQLSFAFTVVCDGRARVSCERVSGAPLPVTTTALSDSRTSSWCSVVCQPIAVCKCTYSGTPSCTEPLAVLC